MIYFVQYLIFIYYSVSRFAQEVVKPKVSQMDETEKLDASVLKGLFDQGVSESSINRSFRYILKNCEW